MKNNRKIVVANWKMNPLKAKEAREIFNASAWAVKKFRKVQLVVCPPAFYLGLLKKSDKKNLSLGVQNIFWEESGSYTGELSSSMAHSLGASFAIVGHSERRSLGETDLSISKKALATVKNGLCPIICIGENERDSGGAYFEFLKDQIKNSLAKITSRYLSLVTIAYEPVWAIGRSSKDAMKPSDVYETSLFIKKVLTDMYGKEAALKVPILYGGSVNFENAGAIVSEGRVAGLLVGRESLNPKSFNLLLKAVNESR